MKGTLVIALGGNAIKRINQSGTAEDQLRNLWITCEQLAEIVGMGYRVAITHGNGPQVGDLSLQQELAKDAVPPQPLDILGAMTQGQIGYMIQQSLGNALRGRGLKVPVVTVLTQVVVDPNDPAFKDPTKPIGPFYDEDEAGRASKERGFLIKRVREVGDKCFRRVVPSPEPREVVEEEAVSKLLDLGFIVISAGGGGIPIIWENDRLRGVEAVIDKDFASEILAEGINADALMFLTDVDAVRLNYGKANEIKIGRISVSEVERYYLEGHFPPGSMGPKVLAAMRFVRRTGNRAIITSLEKAVDALEDRAGTIVFR
ncbi:MAG: carbamate kinase [Candidatus Bathyarchaeia archaeon]